MGKGAESSGLAKALTLSLQDQGYAAADATTAHASRTKNPTFDDDATGNNMLYPRSNTLPDKYTYARHR